MKRFTKEGKGSERLRLLPEGSYQPVFLGAGLLVDGVDFEGFFAGLFVFLSMVTSLRFF